MSDTRSRFGRRVDHAPAPPSPRADPALDVRIVLAIGGRVEVRVPRPDPGDSSVRAVLAADGREYSRALADPEKLLRAVVDAAHASDELTAALRDVSDEQERREVEAAHIRRAERR